MLVLEILMISIMIILGILSAKSDLQRGVIPNSIIKIGLATALIMNIVYAVVGSAPYLRIWFINYGLATALAITMYYAGIWAAGDSKLFICMYGFIPARFFEDTSLAPAITPFILIFLPAYMWTIADSVKLMVRKSKRYNRPVAIKEATMGWLRVVLEASAFSSVVCAVVPGFVANNALFSATVMMIYATICGQWHIMKSLPAIAIHAVVFVALNILGLAHFSMIRLWAYPLFLSLYAIQYWLAGYNYSDISTSMAKPGMILSAGTILRFRTSRVHGLPNNPSENMDSRITQNEADAVHRWEHSTQGLPTITIVRKIPFGIMIVIGFILWIITIWVRWVIW